jgi:hypothetical protein
MDASGCTGKRGYLTFHAARRTARRVNRTRDARVEVYHCNHCASFHVGTTKPKNPDRRRLPVDEPEGL